MIAPRTAAGRDFVALFPNLSHWAAAIEAEAAAQVTEYATGLSDDLGREIAANAALESALRALVTAQERYDSGHGDQEAAWLAVSDALFAARAALAATDVRGALAEALRDTMHRTGWSIAVSEGTSMEVVADAILAALAAKGVE